MAGESDALPDSFAEFSRIYDPEAVERVAEYAEDIEYQGEDGRCRYDDERRILDVRRATDVVLGYSVSHGIAGGEEMDVAGHAVTDGAETALAMLDAAWDPDRAEGEVIVHLPDDTDALLRRTIPADDRDVERYVNELGGPTAAFAVDHRYEMDPRGNGTGKESAEHSAASLAVEQIHGTPVIATYNYRIMDDIEAMGAVPAAPWQILEGIRMAEGSYETASANRTESILERFTEPTEYRVPVEEIPASLRGDLPRDVDVVAPDHSVTEEIADRQRRWNEYGDPVPTWRQALRGVDAALVEDGVEVALPENSGPRMEDTIGGAEGTAVREEMELETEPLPLDLGLDPGDLPPAMGRVPADELSAKAEDYAIAAAAIERSDGTPVVMTYDGDFAEMDGVVAREPTSVSDALLSW